MAENRSKFWRRVRAWGATAATVALVATSVTALAPTPAEAANGGDFNPGNIISDSVFYDANAMSLAQVQGFLDSKVSSCAAGYTCLEDYRQSTFSRAADAMCSAYSGVANQRASEIIVAVAQSCGINPQVLIVLLEKEQGLVSSTAPTAGKYQSATGYACPDTAPCDAQFYGFYNQVYKAAWQYERYRLYPASYGYRAGQVNTIKWHPNAACGTSQVYIENQATAGLYIYTPYRPNAAALNNMYGTGDGCSSYGNRNFWRMFTDWFGNTQGGGSFVKTADSATIYLVAGTYKYPVPSNEIMSAYAMLGPYRTVSASYIDQFTTGISLGQTIRDPTTGEIFFSDLGTKHHVVSCDQLVDYASSCGLYIDLTPSQIKLIPSGADLNHFAWSSTNGAVYYVGNGTKNWLRTMADVVRLNGGTAPAWTNIGPTATAKLKDGPDYIGVGNLIQQQGDYSVYLLDANARLHRVPSVAMMDAFTRTGLVQVSAATLGNYSKGADLTLTVTCGNNVYIAGDGRLYNLAGRGTFGLPNSALDPSTCAVLSKGPDVGASLFVRSPTSGAIYYVANGKKSHMSSMGTVYALNGGASPTLVPLNDELLATIPDGPEVIVPTQLVKTANDATVFMVDGASRKIPIDSFETAAEFGVSGYSVVADATLAPYTAAGARLTVSVTCGSDLYIAGSGRLWRLSGNSSFGLPVTALDPTTCGALQKAPQTVSGPLFLNYPSTGEIFFVAYGQKRHVSSMNEVYSLNGGSMPTLVPVNRTTLNNIPG